MCEFWLECRRCLATPNVPILPVGLGILDGVQAHDGLPLDIVTALGFATFGLVLFVLMLVLMRKIPWVRRRSDKKGQWGALMRDHQPPSPSE
jgi:hypothetical protein